MKRESQAVVLMLVGGFVLRLTLSGDLLSFVNGWMRWPLLLSGGLLVVLGLLEFASDWRTALSAPDGDAADATDPDEHGHRAPKVAWFLLAPVLVIFLVAPPALGSFSAERRLREVPEPAEYAAMRPLRGPEPVPVTITDFLVRSEYDPGLSLSGKRVQVTGFVTTNKSGEWFATRFVMGCCAADAAAYRVRVEGAPPPPDEAWVRITGEWDATQPERPTLQAEEVERVAEPKRPYE